MKIPLTAFFLFTVICCIHAQETYVFKNALSANIPHRYGREALYTDVLAYHLYQKNLRQPAENVAFADGDTTTWQAVTADSAGRLFRRRAGRGGGFGLPGGYFYLTYSSDRARTALLNVQGNSGLFFNGVPHAGDPYSSGWLFIPVQLKKGLNEIYVRGSVIRASLQFPDAAVQLNTADATLPSILLGTTNEDLLGAVVVYNTTTTEKKGLKIKSSLAGREVVTDIPAVPALSALKVPFRFNGSGVEAAGKHSALLSLIENGKQVDTAHLETEAIAQGAPYSETFVSAIDGSVQYYAVTPQTGRPTPGSALFLSVHGAGVEAIGQARAYRSKDWGTLVAATNRRPRGFNWEDWGRIDALEVLELAREQFQPDPQKIYLTGHSMGGHGTWFLGATYPDKWAAIAPSAGYPTLKTYGSADGQIPDSSTVPVEQMLLRSGNQSDVVKLAENYKPLGVYIFHGDSDRVVPVTFARQMRQVLAAFHADMSYYEYPGGSHWFSNESVDWKPLFDFFQWHQRKPDSAVHHIDFKTSSPGISASYYWASILQQQHPLQYSRIRLQRNKAGRSISGTTENIRLLQLDLKDFAAGTALRVVLDGTALEHTTRSAADTLFLLHEGSAWRVAEKPGAEQKGPHRYGTFKDAFNNRMVFVYGTAGSREENEWSLNKARYDAGTWYYRGNGAVELVADRNYATAKYRDRGVVLFGNRNTNRAWNQLLQDAPIQVERGKITAGSRAWQGDDLSAYFVWPIKGSAVASVAVVAGTGLKGMNGANANQYFAGASGFPDFMVYRLRMLQEGSPGIRLAGFFDHNWQLNEQEMVAGEESDTANH